MLSLFRFVDWSLALPPAAEREGWRAIARLEEGRRMPYISSVRRIGIEQGRLEEARRAVLQVVRRRFGKVPVDLPECLETLQDMTQLEALLDIVIAATDLDEVCAALENA